MNRQILLLVTLLCLVLNALAQSVTLNIPALVSDTKYPNGVLPSNYLDLQSPGSTVGAMLMGGNAWQHRIAELGGFPIGNDTVAYNITCINIASPGTQTATIKSVMDSPFYFKYVLVWFAPTAAQVNTINTLNEASVYRKIIFHHLTSADSNFVASNALKSKYSFSGLSSNGPFVDDMAGAYNVKGVKSVAVFTGSHATGMLYQQYALASLAKFKINAITSTWNAADLPLAGAVVTEDARAKVYNVTLQFAKMTKALNVSAVIVGGLTSEAIVLQQLMRAYVTDPEVIWVPEDVFAPGGTLLTLLTSTDPAVSGDPNLLGVHGSIQWINKFNGVNYKPSNAFEAFRETTNMSAPMSYSVYTCTMYNTVCASPEAVTAIGIPGLIALQYALTNAGTVNPSTDQLRELLRNLKQDSVVGTMGFSGNTQVIVWNQWAMFEAWGKTNAMKYFFPPPVAQIDMSWPLKPLDERTNNIRFSNKNAFTGVAPVVLAAGEIISALIAERAAVALVERTYKKSIRYVIMGSWVILSSAVSTLGKFAGNVFVLDSMEPENLAAGYTNISVDTDKIIISEVLFFAARIVSLLAVIFLTMRRNKAGNWIASSLNEVTTMQSLPSRKHSSNLPGHSYRTSGDDKFEAENKEKENEIVALETEAEEQDAKVEKDIIVRNYVCGCSRTRIRKFLEESFKTLCCAAVEAVLLAIGYGYVLDSLSVAATPVTNSNIYGYTVLASVLIAPGLYFMVHTINPTVRLLVTPALTLAGSYVIIWAQVYDTTWTRMEETAVNYTQFSTLMLVASISFGIFAIITIVFMFRMLGTSYGNVLELNKKKEEELKAEKAETKKLKVMIDKLKQVEEDKNLTRIAGLQVLSLISLPNNATKVNALLAKSKYQHLDCVEKYIKSRQIDKTLKVPATKKTELEMDDFFNEPMLYEILKAFAVRWQNSDMLDFITAVKDFLRCIDETAQAITDKEKCTTDGTEEVAKYKKMCMQLNANVMVINNAFMGRNAVSKINVEASMIDKVLAESKSVLEIQEIEEKHLQLYKKLYLAPYTEVNRLIGGNVFPTIKGHGFLPICVEVYNADKPKVMKLLVPIVETDAEADDVKDSPQLPGTASGGSRRPLVAPGTPITPITPVTPVTAAVVSVRPILAHMGTRSALQSSPGTQAAAARVEAAVRTPRPVPIPVNSSPNARAGMSMSASVSTV